MDNLRVDNSALEQLYPARCDSPVFEMERQLQQQAPPPPAPPVHYLDLIEQAARSGQTVDFTRIAGWRR